jgi:hypothetical protein
MTHRDGTSAFWIFGGRALDGSLLNDLHCFDLEAEEWVTCQSLTEAPQPREHHAACFVADRYLVIYGGLDAEGKVIDSASVYDVVTASWLHVAGVPPRARHRIASRGGVMYLTGGIGPDGELAPSIPLQTQIFPFAQTSSFDFIGNQSQALLIKPSPSITERLKQTFSVEAVFYARSFANNQYNPIIVKSDNGLKSGFGLCGQEHPAYKGDAEEGAWVHFFVGAWSQGGHQVASCRIDLETWLHVAGTYDGTNIRLYVNGTLKASVEFPITEEEAETLHSKGDIAIGGMVGKYAFDGMIDECRLWDVSRTEEEIREFINKPSCQPVTPNLLGQWTFNEGCGELVIDSSGSRNHGSFERYAGGVELRRVQSKRPTIEREKTEREKHIDANFAKLQKWKSEFEERNGRAPMKADLALADPEISAIARRLGEFGID